MFQIVIAIENRRNLNKRYKLENIIETILKKKQSNLNCFIEYCELDTNNYPRNLVECHDVKPEYLAPRLAFLAIDPPMLSAIIRHVSNALTISMRLNI